MLSKTILLFCVFAFAAGINVPATLRKRLEISSQKLEVNALQAYTAKYLKPKILHNGTYFVHYDSKYPKSWYEANDFCISNGMRLLQIEDSVEQEAIMSILRALQIPIFTGIWFGLNDLNVESNFVYSGMTSQENSTFQLWGEGEPNNVNNPGMGPGENCGQIIYMTDSCAWNDMPCTYPSPGTICEVLSSCASLLTI